MVILESLSRLKINVFLERNRINLGSLKSQSTLKNDESSLVRSPSPLKRTPSPIEKKITRKSSSRLKLRAGSPPPFEASCSSASKEKSPSPTFQGATPKMTASSSYNIFRRNSSSTKMMEQEQKQQKSSSLSKKKFGFLFMGHSLNQ